MSEQDNSAAEPQTAPAQSLRLIRLNAVERGLCAGMIVVILGVFAVAYCLHPDPSGHGTHTQLGLLPCGTMKYLGVPCPFCGMTTAFALLSHGRLYEGIAAQPAGALLFAIAAAAAPLLLLSAVTGRGLSLPAPRHQKRLFLTAGALLVLAWAYKIVVLLS